MKNSRRYRANPPIERTGVPPVSRYAVKAYGEEEARAMHAALYAPKPKPKGGVVAGES